MKIYFACAIIGGREDIEAYKQIVQALLDDGHQVPTAANAGLHGTKGLETEMAPMDVYTRDTNWIDECEVLVAEVSTPSHGVGYEISYALERGKPVLCIFRRGVPVSKMITGNTRPGLEVASYEDAEEGIEITRKFLRNLNKPLT
jgi:nucleoside 2-deoxyribosyltransferase